VTWENLVDYNLGKQRTAPPRDLLIDREALEALLDQLVCTRSNGTIALREAVA
jgi:hypothetical protein